MNHIIHNISIVLIFFGIILLTHNLTKSYMNTNYPVQQDDTVVNQNTINQDRPSKIFNKMFNLPDVWMGYADFDTKNFTKNSLKGN